MHNIACTCAPSILFSNRLPCSFGSSPSSGAASILGELCIVVGRDPVEVLGKVLHAEAAFMHHRHGSHSIIRPAECCWFNGWGHSPLSAPLKGWTCPTFGTAMIGYIPVMLHVGNHIRWIVCQLGKLLCSLWHFSRRSLFLGCPGTITVACGLRRVVLLRHGLCWISDHGER